MNAELVSNNKKPMSQAERYTRAAYLHGTVSQSVNSLMFSLKEIKDEGYFVELGFGGWDDYIKSLSISRAYIQKLLLVPDRIQGQISKDEFTDKRIDIIIKTLNNPDIISVTGEAKLISEDGQEYDPEDWYKQRLEQDKSEFLKENKELREANKKLKTDKANAERTIEQKDKTIESQNSTLKEVNSVLEYVHGDKEFIKRIMTKKGAIESINQNIKDITDIPSKINTISSELQNDKDVIRAMKILVDLLGTIREQLAGNWNEQFFQDDLG